MIEEVFSSDSEDLKQLNLNLGCFCFLFRRTFTCYVVIKYCLINMNDKTVHLMSNNGSKLPAGENPRKANLLKETQSNS